MTSSSVHPERDAAPQTALPGLPRLPRLPRPYFWGALALSVVVFLFCQGPIWRMAWRMDALNGAVLYSYLAIPVLVLAGLLATRRLSVRAFFLDTLEITFIKYVITFSIALVGWVTTPEPPKAPPAPRAAAPAVSEAPLAPTLIPPGTMGEITGVVTRDGRPVKGALVYVASGLEGVVFAPPKDGIVLANDGKGVSPRLSAAQLGQPISARSADGHLHTLVVEKDGRVLANVPLLGSGAPSPVSIREAHGVAKIRCMVHQRSEPPEEPAYLAVFSHPFFAVTGDDGAFRWKGVPAGALRVAAWEEGRGEVVREVRLEALSRAEVALSY